MSDVVDGHASEVQRGDRFEFGKNWSRFLSRLNDDRIALAERSLASFLGVERLDGKTFLDVGSGSGLFSLAARRLGARVRSFDYDPHSVACTQELKRRYFADDAEWAVERGSVLDNGFLAGLGQFDIVYSWGVLHHTGKMWEALSNVKPLVRQGGQLFIAIYNDLGSTTDAWADIKQTYNRLPRPLALPYALSIIAREEYKVLNGALRRRQPGDWLRGWTEYDKESTRGMSKWHDWIDWIGGWPYERATVEEIAEFYAKDGFRLTRLADRSQGYGCNEFVFNREAPSGTYVDVRLPGGNTLAYRYGVRVVGPFAQGQAGWEGQVSGPLPDGAGDLFLVTPDRLLGPASVSPDGRVVVAPPDADNASLGATSRFLVRGAVRVLEGPFAHQKGKMWGAALADMVEQADAVGAERRSPVFLFEDGRQLPRPHTTHAEIAAHGHGRFSHWGTSLYFSTLDGSDPNTNRHRYEILIPVTDSAPA